MPAAPRPILVTGAHRTGTTWVGRMLAANGRYAYISEPLNVLHRPGVFSAPVTRWYQYITVENESGFMPAYKDLLSLRYHLVAEIFAIRSARDVLRMFRDLKTFLKGRMYQQDVLLKDPFAIFSVDWFIKRLGCNVVITIRHPAAFASSLKRLNWPFNFGDLLSQPSLMRDHLERDRSAMQSVKPDDLLTQAGLLWALIYRLVREICSTNPDIQLVRHEDLSQDPIGYFRQLYSRLGLDFNYLAENAILSSSNPDNPSELSNRNAHSVILDSRGSLENWKKRLGAEEIVRLRRLTESVGDQYYPDIDW